MRGGRLSTPTLLVVTVVIGALFAFWVASAGGQTASPASCGGGDPATEAGTCTVTVVVHDFASGNVLSNYNFIVNVDNSKRPSDPLSLSTESNSPIVRTGNQTRKSFNLPNGRYLVSARSLDHKMWGAYFTLPGDAANDGTLNVPIDLTEQSSDHPLPLGKIRVFVFNDNAWTNGAPDTEEGGLGGFKVGLEEQTQSAVTVDYNNVPLCQAGNVGAQQGCLTGDDGFLQINNLGPASYFINVQAPDSCTFSPPGTPAGQSRPGHWTQTTTIDGGLDLFAPTEEGADGTGAPGEQLWEPPNVRTAYWFGFACVPDDPGWPSSGPNAGGTGEITGTALNWVEWAPYTTGVFGPDAVENPFVALSDATTDETVWMGRGDSAGNFDIQNVPTGRDYNLSVWDEQLNYIMRFKPVHVDAGQTVDVNTQDDVGNSGLGVSRWFGWLDGTVYKDTNNNGQFDAGIDPVIPNTDMDQRWRDGSIKESTLTDANGHYEYPTAEGGALGRWIINEQGFARFSSFPGPSLHDEHTGAVTPSCAVDSPAVPANPCIPTDQGGGLLTNQLLLEGHRATIDWGKRDYPAGTPGQIVGITYFATTRNEFDAQFQAHEDYEAAIPDVTVYLETPGPDGVPNTDDDVIVNKYVTDHWQQPNAGQDPQANGNSFTQNCNPIRDLNGADITSQFNPDLGPNCLEVPLTGQHTKDGAFDGGYAFADFCPNGYDMAADDGSCIGGTQPVPLVAGDYITHVIMPKDPTDSARDCNPSSLPAGDLNVTEPHGSIPGGGQGCLYRIVKEEDVNVDLGNQFAPAIPPPPCNGDDHTIDQSTLTTRSTFYTGDQATSPSKPLCDKHLVTLTNQQNANADFFLMANFPTDPNGEDASNTQTGDVEEPGRVVGQVFNDIYFERNQLSNWYGEPRPIAYIPIGIYARVDIANNGANCGTHDGPTCITANKGQADEITYDQNRWRLIKTLTTSADGSYEALLPSTETLNCPIPQGPCPGMYIAVVDDPGSKAHPNANYNPNLLTANTPFEVWPGLTDQLDTPVDPISGTACEDPAGGGTPDPSDPARPDLLQVSRPYVLATDTGTARRITILSDFIGSAGPTGAAGGHVNLTDVGTGTVTTLTRATGGVVSWTPGNATTPDTIVIQVPAVGGSFTAGPKQLAIVTATANGGVSSVNGITIHVLGGSGATLYNPAVVNVPPPPPLPGNGGPNALQSAIDGAAPGSLIVLSPGTYNENVLVWKPLKIQGVGPGGIIGAHELQGRDPEDPRFDIKGSSIDGRFFQQNFTTFDATVAAHAPYVLPPFTSGPASTVLRGADITVVAQGPAAYGATVVGTPNLRLATTARIDGLGLLAGHGDGAGGVQLQASVNNMQITNNVLENNGGIFAGGLGLGQPYVHGSHNYNVRVANDRLIGNGGLTTSGGAGIFYGSNNYELASSIVCSNFSVEYGGGISHIGLSPSGSIHDNRIYYNDSVDSGAGIAIESELPVPLPPGGALGDGTGSVSIDRNLIQSNMSGDDGGGIFVLDTLDQPISIRNNMIVDNGAADMGGAIVLDDSSKVAIVNNTVSNNVTTGSSENSAVGVPHAAGLATEANETLWQNDSRYAAQYPNPAARPDFSNPVALFNNIFWNNDAMTLDQFSPGATLVDNGFIDFEIRGSGNTADTFTPRYSDLTNGSLLGPDGQQRPVPAGQGNISADPLFVTPFTLELTVSGSRLDPQQAAVTITGADPPVGLTGDYHIAAGSPAVDRGAGFSNLAAPAPGGTQTPNATSVLAPCSGTLAQAYPADFDRQLRPQLRTTRTRTPWDIGADELAGIALRIPGPGNPFNWNGTGQLQCSASTETR
jgi:hypothetical protein